jgi:hypothetical protein
MITQIKGFLMAIEIFGFNVTGGAPVNISIAPSNSTSSADAMADLNITYTTGTRNVTVISGTGTGFAPNPDGRNTAYALQNTAAAKELGKIRNQHASWFDR